MVDNERVVILEEWPRTGKAFEKLISDPTGRKRQVKRENMDVAKMYEEAKGALFGSMERKYKADPVHLLLVDGQRLNLSEQVGLRLCLQARRSLSQRGARWLAVQQTRKLGR